MTVVVTGSGLRVEDVVRVAREGERVELDPEVVRRMAASRTIVDDALARGDTVYGLSTGVGALKRARLSGDAAAVGERLLATHRVGQGPPVDPQVVRAAALCLANLLAAGSTGVRPEIAQRLVEALDADRTAEVPTFGSIGQADLAPMAELAAALIEGTQLDPGEALALIDNNAFSTGWAALALSDARRLLDVSEAAGALSLEAFSAVISPLDPSVVALRPYPGHVASAARIRELLAGSFLHEQGAARDLQDPLSFRCIAHVLGSLRDTLRFATNRVEIELNASQGNPVVLPDRRAVMTAANFDALPLAQAMDVARLGLAPALTSAQERTIKLLDTPWSALPTGLVPSGGSDSGMAIYQIASQALVAEARLLAQPVSFELTSSTVAEGIEDRMTMAPLAARRLAEMVELGERVVAIELVVAAQGVELRGSAPLGSGTREVFHLVREHVPFMHDDGPVPTDLESLRASIRSGGFGRIQGSA